MPAGTNNLALVVTDLSADGFVHWIVVGIDPEITGTAEGLAPAGAIQGKNGFGAIGWGGPCPPAGSGEHEYLVQLYALDKDLGLTDGFDAQPAIDAIEAASMATVSLVGRYAASVTAGSASTAIPSTVIPPTTIPRTDGHERSRPDLTYELSEMPSRYSANFSCAALRRVGHVLARHLGRPCTASGPGGPR